VAIITKELAERIAKKLRAQMDSRPSRAHDLARVWEGAQVVAMFGIRRGSGKDAGHDHIPEDLHVSPRDAKLLGQCPMKREQWIEKLREKGLIESTVE
jgi:hypothetical protein